MTEDPEVNVDHYAWCGMWIPLQRRIYLSTARRVVARRLRWVRSMGAAITVRTPGYAWEIYEPDDAVMIPDWAGVLRITPFPVPVTDEDDEFEYDPSLADA